MKRRKVHTIILGSGAAGLSAAVRLYAEGVHDILLLSEGLNQGTSINTGSDKQTYYKMGVYGEQADSPNLLAETYLTAGGMHGDLAMVEATLSLRTFFNLVNLGVPFPHDRYGQYIGYKTDHDPYRRATSCGPYTSREMCRALIAEVRKNNIPVYENRVAVKLLTMKDSVSCRICGLLTINTAMGEIEAWQAENIIFAVGGPGGLYESSVYPEVHTGAIGLALEIGAMAQGLPESQFGIASSTDISQRSVLSTPSDDEMFKITAPVSNFRWNVSGTFMQVLPRFISTKQDGINDESEFLRPWFSSVGKMNSCVFLKGYQWPFDVRKVNDGSSLIDLIVYYETVVRGRRVFLDFRSNPEGTNFDELEPEALEYLRQSDALFGTPIERLARMNPAAIQLYRDHRIDLAQEPLEVSVCAQHNNGGLAGNIWYESLNISHFFPIGEVNGSHGVARPGGSALNAGQVGAFRAAEFIAHRYQDYTLNEEQVDSIFEQGVHSLLEQIRQCAQLKADWRTIRHEFQKRMSLSGAHLRNIDVLHDAVTDAWKQWYQLTSSIVAGEEEQIPITADIVEQLRNRQLCLAHAVYLDAILFQVESGVGSRGSCLVVDRAGKQIHSDLPDNWKMQEENPAFLNKVLITQYRENESNNQCDNQKISEDTMIHRWLPRRNIPKSDDWFENVWRDYRENTIFQ